MLGNVRHRLDMMCCYHSRQFFTAIFVHSFSDQPIRRIQPQLFAFRSIELRKRIGQYKSRDPFGQLTITFEDDLASHRQPTEDTSINRKGLEEL